ncbi:divergent polysaccharide deacetylase family protein, partial [bacterium]|nr:divergent polysaccharide deacetylase family protein [bacterium]
HSNFLAVQANNMGFEVIIHMPMESIKNLNPGPGAILKSMNDSQIKDLLEKNIKSVPYSIGINNHMGSKITRDYRCMKIIMSDVKERGMLFIDSFVIGDSVARKTAEELEMPVLKRDVFLDNQDDPVYIKNQLLELIKIAKKNGKAIGIGHITKVNTIQVISEMINEMKEQGVKFCYVSEVAN